MMSAESLGPDFYLPDGKKTLEYKLMKKLEQCEHFVNFIRQLELIYNHRNSVIKYGYT